MAVPVVISSSLVIPTALPRLRFLPEDCDAPAPASSTFSWRSSRPRPRRYWRSSFSSCRLFGIPAKPIRLRFAFSCPTPEAAARAVQGRAGAVRAETEGGASRQGSPTGEQRNPIGVHANVWVGSWSPDEARFAISKSAELGYDLIEVPVFSPASVNPALTKALLQEHGLGASGSLGLTLDKDISSPDPLVSQRGVELLLSALQAVAAFGGTHLVGVTHSAIAKYPHAFPGGQARQNLVQGLRTVASRAEDVGLVFGLEVVNRYESNVLNTAAQAMELVEEVGHGNVWVHLDSYHMNIEESSVADAVAVCGDRLGYIHIGECHRGYLGSGSVDFEQLFRALARSGYKGPITFESFSSRVVSPDLSNNLAVWRNLWDDSEDLARHAKAYMDSQWVAAKRACAA